MSTTKTAKTAKASKLNLKELQAQQANDERPEKSVSGSEDSEYKLHSYESHYVHVEILKKENDPVQKEYVDRKKTVKLYPVEFERMEKNGSFDEYDKVTILHDGRKSSAKSSPTPAGKGPMEPLDDVPTLQDAQMRFQELYPEDKELTASKTYEELVQLIKDKDPEFEKPAAE